MYIKSWSYAILFLRYDAWRMQLFFILGYFLPYSPLTAQKNTFGDIILHECTKNHDHMLYYYWDMPRDGCNCYFSFWAIFAVLPSWRPEKLTFWKNEKTAKTKKLLEILSFYTCTKNYDQMMYGSWDMKRDDGRMKKVTQRGGCPT